MVYSGQFPALVLNADFKPLDYHPLSTWKWQEAVTAAITDKVTVVEEYDETVGSPSFRMKIPSVIALREYIPRRERPSFTRTNLIVLRDRCSCAYCGQKFPANKLTYDHVIPRSMKGRHTWTNVVSACLECNQRKKNRTPEQAKMPLLWRPYEPTAPELLRAAILVTALQVHESWKQFVPMAA